MGVLEDMLAERDPKALLELALTKQAEAANTPPLTTGQNITAGLLGIAPLIAGAIKGGDNGLYQGASAGLLGLGNYEKQLGEEQKRKQEFNKAAADLAIKQAMEMNKEKFDIQRDIGKEQLERETKKMFPDKGTSIEFKLPGDSQLSEKVAVAQSVARQVGDISKFIEDEFKSQLKKGENIGEVILRKGSGMLPETKQRDLNSKIKRLQAMATASMVKGNPNAYEHSLVIEGFLTGEYGSIKDIYKALGEVKQGALADAELALSAAGNISQVQSGKMPLSDVVSKTEVPQDPFGGIGEEAWKANKAQEIFTQLKAKQGQ